MKQGFDQKVAAEVFRLSWPSMLEQLLIMMATLVDTAMLGALGSAATASVGVIAPMTWVANGLMLACATGFSYLISRAHGAGDRGKVHQYLTQSLSFSAVVGLFLTGVYFTLRRLIPLLLGAAPEVLPHSAAYLGIIAFGLCPQTIAVALSTAYRSAGNSRLPMQLNLIANFANVIGNFFMIFPTRRLVLGSISFMMPGLGMGVAGAALSTALSQLLLLLMLLLSVPRKSSTFGISLRGGDYRITREVLTTARDIGLPVLFERWTLNFGQVFATAIISRLGTDALSAHYLTCQIEGVLYMPAFGMQYAATALIGQAFGAGDRDLVLKYKRYIILMGVAVIELFCVPVAVGSKWIMQLFTTSNAVVVLGSQTLFIAAVTELFFSLSLIATGIFRGAGDVRFAFGVCAFGMWAVRLPLLLFSVFVLKRGIIAVWLIAGFDCMLRMLLSLWRLRGSKWLRTL